MSETSHYSWEYMEVLSYGEKQTKVARAKRYLTNGPLIYYLLWSMRNKKHSE